MSDRVRGGKFNEIKTLAADAKGLVNISGIQKEGYA